AAAAIEVDLAAIERQPQRLLVHVRNRQHLTRAGVLHHAGHEPALVEAHLRRVSGGLHDHRAIVRTPAWAPEGAASAPSPDPIGFDALHGKATVRITGCLT